MSRKVSAATRRLSNALELPDYAALRAYTGPRKSVIVTGHLVTTAPAEIAGMFVCDKADTISPDNGGTIIVDAGGRRWKRRYEGAISVQWFGAVGDGIKDDREPCQAAIDAGGKGAVIVFQQTKTNVYAVSGPLKFYSGQEWQGAGGVDVMGTGTQIKLIAESSSAAEPALPGEVTYGFNPRGIYFNAQDHAPAGLSLYNTSYALVDQCAANAARDGAAAMLLDSDTGKQCYFNKLNQPRVFANGVGGVGIRFTRGANANQVFGGKCGSSTRGMEFLSLSSGNLVVGTDFENNTDRHIFVDAPNNVFIGTHMESVPVGFHITANATNTQRMNTTFASSTVVSVQDASRIGTTLDTRNDALSTKGDLRFGPAKFAAEYLTAVTRLDYDPDLVSAASQALVRFFLNTNTTGTKQVTLYKGDGTATATINLNAGTGEVFHGDLNQDAGGGVARKTIRRNSVPVTGAWRSGDICFFTAPVAGGKLGAVCVADGTPGTWKTFGLIDA